MVEEMLALRGIMVSHETVRQWGLKFGRAIATRIRPRRLARGDKWHLDEVVISIAGKKHYLWRGIDQDGFVLDVLVQSRRDKKAAKRLLRKLLKKQGRAPRVLITDKLKSYSAAKKGSVRAGASLIVALYSRRGSPPLLEVKNALPPLLFDGDNRAFGPYGARVPALSLPWVWTAVQRTHRLGAESASGPHRRGLSHRTVEAAPES